MAIIPDKSDAEMRKDLELMNWRAPPSGLSGIVFDTIEQLNRAIASTNDGKQWGEIFLSWHEEGRGLPGYDVYSNKGGAAFLSQYVAYGCPSCKKIVAGPPVINAETGEGEPLASRDGLDYRCANCHAHLREETLKLS